MSIKHWPAADRPREKLLRLGSSMLTDAELLAIFLRTGCSGKSAVDLARELLTQFGGLRALLESSEKDFCRGLGLGRAKYTQLQAVVEMARRHFGETLAERPLLNSCEKVKEFLCAQLRHKHHEVFAALYLDNQHKLILFEELSQGTIDGATIFPREVVKKVLHHNAAALIFCHNHPSGDVTPSDADCEITRQLTQALNLIDVRVLDHIIVGDGLTTSLAEKGLM